MKLNGSSCLAVPTGLFINNVFEPSLSGSTIEVRNPAYGTVLGNVSAAEAADVDKSVELSEAAYKTTLQRTSCEDRRKLLLRLAGLVERDAEGLASLEAVDAGV